MSAPVDNSWTFEARSALQLVRDAHDPDTIYAAWAALSDAARVAWACNCDEARDLLDQARRWIAANQRERSEGLILRALRIAERVAA